MKKIYCNFCGTNNKITSEKCIKCGKSLDQEDHPWREYLYDHIKDDLKGNVTDNIFSLITNFVKSHLYGVIISLTILVTATTGVVKVVNNSYIKEVKENKNIPEVISLDIESDLVKSIYAYNKINDEMRTDNGFYQDKLVSFNDLTNSTKFDLTYRFNKEKSRNDDKSTCEFLKGYSLYERCLEDSEYYLDYSYSNVNKEDLEKTWHKLFGSSNPLPLENFVVDEIRECEYSEEKDDYLCYMGMVGGYWVPEQITKIIKADKIGKNIYIYDYFIILDAYYEFGTFKDPYGKIMISPTEDESLIEQGQIYKHTYKEDIDGNCYWVSSEPIDSLD